MFPLDSRHHHHHHQPHSNRRHTSRYSHALPLCAFAAIFLACNAQPIVDPEQPNSFDGTDTGHPLLDSIRLASRDLFNHPGILRGGPRLNFYPRSNTLVERLFALGYSGDALFTSVAAFYPNTFDMRLHAYDSGRFRAVSIANSVLCLGLPSDTDPPTLRGGIRPAVVDTHQDSENAYFSWPSSRSKQAYQGIPDFDFCLDLTPSQEISQLMAQRNYSIAFSGEEDRDQEVRFFTDDVDGGQSVLKSLQAEISKGNQTNPTELARTLALKFKELADGPIWTRASSLVGFAVGAVSLPPDLPQNARRLGALQRKRNDLPDAIQAAKRFGLVRDISNLERLRGLRDGSVLRRILTPAVPNAVSNVDISLAMAAAISGVVVDEILVTGAARILSSGATFKSSLQAVARVTLALILLGIDTLPLVVLLTIEVQASRWKGYAITGTSEAGRFDDSPVSFALSLSMTYIEGRVVDTRVALLASLLALVLCFYTTLIGRRFYKIIFGRKTQQQLYNEKSGTKKAPMTKTRLAANGDSYEPRGPN